MSRPDALTRFSNRVADYARSRPGYPEEVVETFFREAGSGPGAVVADIGSGTGISSKLFLDAGCRVVGVEPNAAMRQAAEAALSEYPRFQSVDGSAEATTLPGGSIDLIVCGQAFHWFDRESARSEWQRILRPEGWAALFWNSRRTEGAPLLAAYERLVEHHATDYREVNHRKLSPEAFADFFGGAFRRFAFPNRQVVDLDGLRGRLLSSSYMPAPGAKGHDEMLREIEKIFARHQDGGAVTIEYETELYLGKLG